MTAQKRETGRNYIGLLHEETGAACRRLIGGREAPYRGSVLGLMAAMVKRRSEAG